MVRTALKWVGNIVTAILILLVVMAAVVMIQGRIHPDQVPSIFGFKPMSVLSGSMEPALSAGDMIGAREVSPDNIKVGDVITFENSDGVIITHRVIDIVNQDGLTAFKTKGDANNVEDQELISGNQIIGSLVFNIPYGGYASNFARSTPGFIILILIPVLLLLSGEIKSLLSSVGEEEKKKLVPKESKEA